MQTISQIKNVLVRLAAWLSGKDVGL